MIFRVRAARLVCEEAIVSVEAASQADAAREVDQRIREHRVVWQRTSVGPHVTAQDEDGVPRTEMVGAGAAGMADGE